MVSVSAKLADPSIDPGVPIELRSHGVALVLGDQKPIKHCRLFDVLRTMNHCSASLLTNTFAAARLHNDSPPKVQTTGSNKPKLTEESIVMVKGE